MKKVAIFLLTLCFAIQFASYSLAADKQFKDIPANHWAKGYVDRMTKASYFKGYPDNTFKPNNNITRVEFIAVLARILDNLYKDKIVITENDLNNAYVDADVKNISWALNDYKKMTTYLYLFGQNKETIDLGKQELGYIFGEKFEPNKNITRAEVVAALYNIFDKARMYVEKSNLKDISKHKFNLEIQALETARVLSGYPDKTFKPDKGITRAEISKIIDIFITKKSQLQNVKYNPAKEAPAQYNKYLGPIDVIKTVLTLERDGDYASAYQYYSEDDKKTKGYTSYLDYMKSKVDQASYKMQIYDPKILEYKEVKEGDTTKVYFRKYNKQLDTIESIKVRELTLKDGKWYINFKFIIAPVNDWE